MPAPHNMLKEKLKVGELTHGIWLGLASPYLAEIAATAGFDWLLVDGEHAPLSIEAMSHQMGILLAHQANPVLRLADDDPTKIKQALDIGAQTLLIPMIESGAQAARAVRSCLYPPQGMRGVGSALARASRFGAIPDYLATANAQICLMLQVESVVGMAALDEIIATDGVDGVFIGPSDLAADMGHLGNPTHPAVKASVLDAISRIRAAGKTAGVLTTDPAYIADCRAAGANFLGVGIDVTLYASALRNLAKSYR